MSLRILLPLGLLLAMAGPALSAPFCTDDRAGASVTFGNHGFHRGDSETDLNAQDLTELQRRGVPATSVERWNGCIRAFVTKPDGTQGMEFFDPNTMRPVY
jgi:hypothetical protein